MYVKKHIRRFTQPFNITSNYRKIENTVRRRKRQTNGNAKRSYVRNVAQNAGKPIADARKFVYVGKKSDVKKSDGALMLLLFRLNILRLCEFV